MFHITLKSQNAKTGNIPVTTSGMDTCPDSCGLKKTGACYGMNGPISWHWKKVSNKERGVNFEAFIDAIKALPDGQLWRHNQVGDMQPWPGHKERISTIFTLALTHANKGKRGFTYTHYPVLGEGLDVQMNRHTIKCANEDGFTINLSANDAWQADRMLELDIGPVVTLLPFDSPKVSLTPGGNKIVKCPAQSLDDMDCKRCGLCAVADRKYVIGFEPHGAGKNVVHAFATILG